MKPWMRFIYISSAFAGCIGAGAVAWGWRPPLEVVAVAAFLALTFAAFARDVQASRGEP